MVVLRPTDTNVQARRPPMSILIEKELPKRLETQRVGIGYTLDELSKRTSFSVETLRLFELPASEGGRLPMLHELNRLAWALGIDPMVLLDDKKKALDPKRLPARFRAQEGADLSPDDVRLLAMAAEVGRVTAFLWHQLGRGGRTLDISATRITDEHAGIQGAHLGAEARLTWDEPGQDVRGPILSLKGDLERRGVHVAWVPFSNPRVDGASVVEPKALPVILLNTKSKRILNPCSARMVMAHELCHLLHDGLDERKRTPLRSAITLAHDESQGSREEQRANAFAPAFLAPPRSVRAQAGDDLYSIARALVSRWGFTPEAAAWHARVIIGATKEEAQAAHRQLKSQPRGSNSQFTDDRPPRECSLASGLLSTLAQDAQRQGIISQGRLSELLRLQ